MTIISPTISMRVWHAIFRVNASPTMTEPPNLPELPDICHALVYQTIGTENLPEHRQNRTENAARTTDAASQPQPQNRRTPTDQNRPDQNTQPRQTNCPDRTYSRKPADKNKRQGYAIEPDKHYPTSTRDAYIHTSPKAVSEPDAPEARTTDAAKAASGERAALCCTETRRLNLSNAQGGYSTFPTQRGV